MEERESDEVPNREDPSEGEGGDEDEEDCEQPSKKKKKVNVPRQWNEVNLWNREDHALQDIKAFIRAELDDLNRSAGILHVPGAHKDRNNEYGNFQFRRQWITRDKVEHFLYACPLLQRCKCQCEAKISHFPTAIILYVSKLHTAHDHVCERDSGKYLTFQQKSFIANAIKVAPLQTGSKLIRNVQDSPTKAIDHKYKGSVDRLVRKQREKIVNVSLDGMVIDNTLGSLSRLANAIWIVDAWEDHKQGVLCLDLFKVYCIWKQIMGSDCTVFLTFATGEHLQTLLVDWLRSVREGRATEWFETWWCGPVKGRWLLGHGGVAMSGNNQGLESKWLWDSKAISHGRQVSGMSVAKICSCVMKMAPY
jgi:hypothetical protein